MNLFFLAKVIIKYRRTAAVILGGSIVLSLSLCFLLPKRYTASFAILPNPKGGIIQAPLLSPGSVSGAGPSLSGMNMLLIRFLDDREFITRAMSKRFVFWTREGINTKSLSEVLGVEDTEGAVRKGRKCIHAFLDKMNGTLRVSVETPYPELSYKLAAYILSELDGYLDGKREEYKASMRSYYSSRIEQARSSLAFYEEELGIFLSKNRGFDESDHPEEKLDIERLKRKQDIYTGVYLNLRKRAEMEDNKINELIPPLMVIDRPVIPSIKSYPRRKVVLIKGIILGLVLASLAVILRYEIDNLKLLG